MFRRGCYPSPAVQALFVFFSFSTQSALPNLQPQDRRQPKPLSCRYPFRLEPLLPRGALADAAEPEDSQPQQEEAEVASALAPSLVEVVEEEPFPAVVVPALAAEEEFPLEPFAEELLHAEEVAAKTELEALSA